MFLEKYSNENFDDYTNLSYLIRSSDKNGNLVIFVSTDLENAFSKGPYIVTLDGKSGKFMESSFKLMSVDSINVDVKKLNYLAERFYKYQVQRLGVDNNKNVYIGLNTNDKPTLIRFSDKKYVSEKYKNWINIKDLWFEEN